MREVDIFRNHCPVPLADVQAYCHEVLMRMLPGIAEGDIDLFGSSINAIQCLGFKKVELDFQPPAVTGLLDAMRASGAAGAGMSSFGPALYAIGDTDMKTIERDAQAFMNEHGGGTTLVTDCQEPWRLRSGSLKRERRFFSILKVTGFSLVTPLLGEGRGIRTLL